MEQALHKLTGERIHIMGASRTDAGVHAKGQVIAFHTLASLPRQAFITGLNHYLPQDIAIRDCLEVGDNFHPRRQAISREYRYTILNSHSPSPLQRRQAYFVHHSLDIEPMNQACQSLEGKQDFAPFTTPAFKGKGTVRTCFKAEVQGEGELVLFNIVADSFLPQQVRRIVGALIRVGLGRMTAAEFQELVRSRQLGLADLTAPARGLCLMKINYPNLRFEND